MFLWKVHALSALLALPKTRSEVWHPWVYLNLLALTSCLIGTNEQSLAKCICVWGSHWWKEILGQHHYSFLEPQGSLKNMPSITWQLGGPTVKRREPKRLATRSQCRRTWPFRLLRTSYSKDKASSWRRVPKIQTGWSQHERCQQLLLLWQRSVPRWSLASRVRVSSIKASPARIFSGRALSEHCPAWSQVILVDLYFW